MRDARRFLSGREADPWAMVEALEEDPAWQVALDGFDPTRERSAETLLTVGNGYCGLRGAPEEGHPAARPGVFLAGVFDPIRTVPDPPPEPPDSPRLVACPDWTRLSLAIDGEPLLLAPERLLDHRRILRLDHGLLGRYWRQRLASGRVVRLWLLRVPSLADRHVFVQVVRLRLEDGAGEIRLEALLDGRGDDGLVPCPEFMEERGPSGSVSTLTLCTARSGLRVALAQFCRLREGDRPLGAERRRERRCVAEHWGFRAETGRDYRFERVVAAFTSREVAEPRLRAVRRVLRARRSGTDTLLEQHRERWAERWRAARIDVEGDPEAERALRFAAFQLMAAAHPEDERVSIGARALSGTAYQGHVFWDTEIYLLPFFIYTWPAAARALLMYRWHTLPAARAKAARLGYRGALYAWESAATGHEATVLTARGPNGEAIPIYTGERAHHISAAVAYAVRHYWQASGDDGFMLRAGAEIALETARFWASRAGREADGRYHIRGTLGPDEYHEQVDDSAYVNAMARFNLEFGGEVAAWLRAGLTDARRELGARLNLREVELAEWRTVAAGLADGYRPETRLYEAFAGYFGLADLDLAALEPRSAALQVLLGREATARTRIVKQADVVLLGHLLRDRIDPAVAAANFAYYEPRCDHASSLSPAIHALEAARLGRPDLAERYFRQAAAIDLGDDMGNAALGLHAAALGGLWQAAVFGAAGMRLMADGLAFDPRLLPGWEALRFAVIWRGRRLAVELRPERAEFRLAPGGPPMAVRVGDEVRVLEPGEAMASRYD
jgi:trehalose/maltose hydrolase-like predicted phosphorylase